MGEAEEPEAGPIAITEDATGNAQPRPARDLAPIESAPTVDARSSQPLPGESPTPAAIELSNYTVHELLGAGGFGQVFRARQDKIGRDVAIKVLHAKYSTDPIAVARFVAEARAVNLISHPGIVEVFDFGQLADGRSYFVMELLRGRSLRDLLRARSTLPLAEALPLLTAIAEAIDAAHAAGIAHRDLKPDNVFVLEDGTINTVQNGIEIDSPEDAPVTETGAVFGTPLYMSPEQCRGAASDTRSDAYSFGVLAYQLLVGELPFTGDALTIALHHLNDPPPPPSTRNPELTDRVDRVLLALLAKDPADRPLPLAGAIARISPDAPLPPRPPARVRRVAVLGALGLLVSTAAIMLVVRHETQPGAPLEDAACPRAASRLVGVWDAPTRAKVETRFAASPRLDAPGVWRVLAAQLDARSAQWATMWDAACTSQDRINDPLLYAQRLTCLENALLETRSTTDVLVDVDAGAFMENFFGINANPLEDCQSTEILRAQPAAAPASKRDAIVAREANFNRISWKAWAAVEGEQATTAEPQVAAMRAAIHELKDIGSPRVPADLVNYAQLMWTFAVIRADDLTRPAAARAAAHEAIDYATVTRDDVALPSAYATLSDLETSLGDRAAASAALDRAEAALARAGKPRLTSFGIAMSRARIEAARGALDVALAAYRHAQALATTLPDVQLMVDQELSYLLGRLGFRTDAAQLVQKSVTASDQRWGEPFVNTTLLRNSALWLMLAANDIAGARAQSDKVIATLEALHAPSIRRGWAYVERAVLATIDGNMEAAIASGKQWASAIANGASIDAPFLIDIAAAARGAGASEMVALALGQAELLHPDATQRAAMMELRALVAFERGDDAAMVEAARQVPPDPKNERVSPWLLAIADARAGHAALADARLHAARAHVPTEVHARASAELLEGIALVALRRGPDAITQLEKVRADMSASGISGLEVGEAMTWLGVARLEGGDAAGAREVLEDAVGSAWSLTTPRPGGVYFSPIAQLALGRALWTVGVDRPRAIRQVEAARDGFALQGPPRARDRQLAISWLAEHRDLPR